jgi:FMN phosphatase YigB (HAD superfamily)
VAVSFDLFDTLVSATRPDEPWVAAAGALADRGVTVPADWEAAYRSSHRQVDRGAELSLVTHTLAALESRGVDADRGTVREALLAAFDGPVSVRDGAVDAVCAAAATGPVCVLSNCSLPGLVARTLSRAALPVSFDAVVTSVDCGWRKPHDRAFEAAADRLGVAVAELVHVGDDPRADGGGRTAGATVVLTGEVPLPEVPAWLECHS